MFRSVFDKDDVFWKEDRPRTKWEAWLYILHATHWDTEPGEVKVRGQIVPIYRGEVYLSRRTFAREMQWDDSKARRYLETARKLARIVPTDRAAYGIHKVINYDAYNPYFGEDAGERAGNRPAKEPATDPLPIMKNEARSKESDSSLSFWQVVKAVKDGTITHGIRNGVTMRALLGNDGKGVVLDAQDGHSIPVRVYSPKQIEEIDWLPTPTTGEGDTH